MVSKSSHPPSSTVSHTKMTSLENLTKEQYSGVARSSRRHGILSASRDTLNPLLNSQNLKNRLALIQHYKTVHGDHAFWPHFFMRRVANHAMKYKFNYAVKGFAAYLVYRDFANYQHMKETSFMTMQSESK